MKAITNRWFQAESCCSSINSFSILLCYFLPLQVKLTPVLKKGNLVLVVSYYKCMIIYLDFDSPTSEKMEVISSFHVATDTCFGLLVMYAPSFNVRVDPLTYVLHCIVAKRF